MKTSEQIRAEIAAVPPEIRVAYVHTLAARLAVQGFERTAAVSLLNFRGGEDLANPANNVSNVIAFARSDAGRDLAAARITLDLLEGSPEFKEASAILDPLEAALAAAVERELAEDHAHRLAEVAVEEAEEAARVKLAAKIGDDPQVKKAKAALAGIKRLGQPLEEIDPALELAADFH